MHFQNDVCATIRRRDLQLHLPRDLAWHLERKIMIGEKETDRVSEHEHQGELQRGNDSQECHQLIVITEEEVIEHLPQQRSRPAPKAWLQLASRRRLGPTQCGGSDQQEDNYKSSNEYSDRTTIAQQEPTSM
jgi:hypothetical protein